MVKLPILKWLLGTISLVVAFLVTSLPAQTIAPTPPMGWNSWQAYGFSINEQLFRQNAAVLAGLKQYGWQYVIIDEGWYMENPAGNDLATRKYDLDAFGRLIPAVAHYQSASNGAGFKPLADWVHSQGLKFGIHIVRGIPRQAVQANSPIANSTFHAVDAADTTDTCPWDDGNYGIRDNAAGQAYYDQIFRLYADWGVDYVKVDCIADRPYRPTEIRQIAEAIKKTGRPIVLSLSPGPTHLEHAAEVAKYAQLWRISDDHWDIWCTDRKDKNDEFAFSTCEEFDRIAAWNPYVKPGNWPDPDMFPFGSLTPTPGFGEARTSRLTHTEEQTEFTLWAISRSPLILGTNLTQLDDFTRSLITNKQLIDVNQHARESHPVKDLPPGFEKVRVWLAIKDHVEPAQFLALFNLDDKPVTLHVTPKQLRLPDAPFDALNLIDGSRLKRSRIYEFTLPAHGSLIYELDFGYAN